MRVRSIFAAACVGAAASAIVGCGHAASKKVPNPHFKETDAVVYLDSDCTTMLKNETPVAFQRHNITWNGVIKCPKPADLPAGTPDFEIRFTLQDGQTDPLQCPCTGTINPQGKLNAKFSVTGNADLYKYTLYIYGKPYSDPDLEIDP